jgi:hypothetical protein
MRKATVFFLILGVSSLNVAVLAASASCALGGNNPEIAAECCCGDNAACDLPASQAGVAEACCELTQTSGHPAEQAAPAAPRTIASHHSSLSEQIACDAPRSVAPTPRSTAQDTGPEQPPPYTLFCSLLI